MSDSEIKTTEEFGCLNCSLKFKTLEACMSHMEKEKHFILSHDSGGIIKLSYPILYIFYIHKSEK